MLIVFLRITFQDLIILSFHRCIMWRMALQKLPITQWSCINQPQPKFQIVATNHDAAKCSKTWHCK